ncbi:MAG TPA: TetR/AcrR family transcriptional regulator [Phycisphaerae bacterium]|nr:TetR/AcrR family transcriptional regulator [Phycisphaerae bacterium]HPS52399.1 TetR/AcrR family transcriptional regulator [Phycisphaerae bacterium]
MRTINIDGQSVDQEKIRPLILEACIEVLNVYGQNGLTMSRIARQAGIAKGTLYNYFSNKEELLKSVCELFFKPIFDQILMMLDAKESPRKILITMALAEVATFRQYRRVIEAFLLQFGKNSLVDDYASDSFKGFVMELVKRIFELAQTTGADLPFPPKIMAELYDGAAMGLARCIPKSSAEDTNAFPCNEELERFVDIFLPRSRH